MADDEKVYKIRIEGDSDDAVQSTEAATTAVEGLGEAESETSDIFATAKAKIEDARDALDEAKDAANDQAEATDKSGGSMGRLGGVINGLKANVVGLLNPYALATAAIAAIVVKIKEQIAEMEAAHERARTLAAEGIDVLTQSYDDLERAQDRALVQAGDLVTLQGQRISASDREIVALQDQARLTRELSEAQRDAAIAAVELQVAQGEISPEAGAAEIAGIEATGRSDDRDAYLESLRQEVGLRERAAEVAAEAANAVAQDASTARRRADQALDDPDLAADERGELDTARSFEARTIRDASAENSRGGVGYTEDEVAAIETATAERQAAEEAYHAAQRRAILALEERAEALEGEAATAIAAARDQQAGVDSTRSRLGQEETVGQQVFGLREQTSATRAQVRQITAAETADETTETGTASDLPGVSRRVASGIDDGRGSASRSGALASGLNRAVAAVETDGGTASEIRELGRLLEQVIAARSSANDETRKAAMEARAMAAKALSQIKNNRPTGRQ